MEKGDLEHTSHSSYLSHTSHLRGSVSWGTSAGETPAFQGAFVHLRPAYRGVTRMPSERSSLWNFMV